MSKASNAVLALSRAFYGKRLNEKQYNDLLSCKSINEIASYLRSSTVYSSAFEGVPAADFTARSLEDIIDRFRFERFMSICRYELAIGNDFYKYFIVKTETEQILRCTLLMLGQR
ncbi:MAG: V-type ATPase subunit, partial [Acutalibacteraceae bacterium]